MQRVKSVPGAGEQLRVQASISAIVSHRHPGGYTPENVRRKRQCGNCISSGKVEQETVRQCMWHGGAETPVQSPAVSPRSNATGLNRLRLETARCPHSLLPSPGFAMGVRCTLFVHIISITPTNPALCTQDSPLHEILGISHDVDCWNLITPYRLIWKANVQTYAGVSGKVLWYNEAITKTTQSKHQSTDSGFAGLFIEKTENEVKQLGEGKRKVK